MSDKLENCLVSENSKYILAYNSNKATVVLTDKSSGKEWSSMPTEAADGLNGRAAVTMGSPIYVEYLTAGSDMLNTAYASTSSINEGLFNAKLEKDSVTITYYLDEFEISVPVEYRLTSDGLVVSIDPKKIKEGKNTVFSISLMPFLCSAKNDTENSYLFVPSGSGAIMKTDVRTEGVRTFSGEVFGLDKSRENKIRTSNTIGIKLPVFGAKYGDYAIFAEITDGESQSFIEAQAGDEAIGYSSVYPRFYIRGYDYIETKSNRSGITKQLKIADSLSENVAFSVTYHPLNGEKASYSGMAEYYRRHISHKKSDDSICILEAVGGIRTTRSFFGIPYSTELVLTEFDDLKNIIKSFSDDLSERDIQLVLSGFGKGLATGGQIASNFEISPKLGGVNAFKSLQNVVKDNVKNIYIDYDVVNFSKSSKGFSTGKDAAKSVSGIRAYQYTISPFLGSSNENAEISYLLKTDLLNKATGKLIGLIPNTGIGLSSLSNTAYSDYSNNTRYSRKTIKNKVSGIIEKISKIGVPTMGSSANSYAAENLDLIKDVPMWSDEYNCFDRSVPFYAMVYKGHTAISATALNASSNERLEFLKSLESGMALKYTVISDYDTECIKHYEYPYAEIVYKDDAELIKSQIAEAKDFLVAVLNTEIKQNTELANGVSVTEFSNGCRIIVNYNENPCDTEYGRVDGRRFIWERQ